MIQNYAQYPQPIEFSVMEHPVSPPATAAFKNTGLHRLPAEVRNEIYELCLIRHDKGFQVGEVTREGSEQFLFSKEPTESSAPSLVPSYVAAPPPPPPDKRVPFMALTNFNSPEPALLRTSRAIRNEALSMFYSLNTFRLHHPDLLRDWLLYIGHDRRAALRRVECIHPAAPIEKLLQSWTWPPMHYMLLAVESFETTLALLGAEAGTGVLRYNLFKGPPGPLENYSEAAMSWHWKDFHRIHYSAPNEYVWSSGFDVAGRMIEENWLEYVDQRLAMSRKRRVTAKGRMTRFLR